MTGPWITVDKNRSVQTKPVRTGHAVPGRSKQSKACPDWSLGGAGRRKVHADGTSVLPLTWSRPSLSYCRRRECSRTERPPGPNHAALSGPHAQSVQRRQWTNDTTESYTMPYTPIMSDNHTINALLDCYEKKHHRWTETNPRHIICTVPS